MSTEGTTPESVHSSEGLGLLPERAAPAAWLQYLKSAPEPVRYAFYSAALDGYEGPCSIGLGLGGIMVSVPPEVAKEFPTSVTLDGWTAPLIVDRHFSMPSAYEW